MRSDTATTELVCDREDARAINALLCLAFEHTPLQQILDHALGLILSALGIPASSPAGVYLVEDAPRRLELKAGHGLPEKMEGACTSGHGIDRYPSSTPRVRRGNGSAPNEGTAVTQHLCVPIVSHGQMIGALHVRPARTPAHSAESEERQRRLLTELADALARVISHTREVEALRDSERQYRDLADLLPQPVFEADKQLRITSANQSALDYFGYTSQELEQGLSIPQMIAPEDLGRAAENIRKVMAGGPSSGQTYEAIRKDGSTFPIVVRSSPVIRDGEAVGLRGVMLDITERRRVEEELRASEEKYRSLFEYASDAIFIVDPSTRRILDVNDNACESLGYTRDELRHLRLDRVSTAGFVKTHRQVMAQLRERGHVVLQSEHRRKDGTLVQVETSSRLVSYGGQQVIQSFVRDITARKKTDELREQLVQRLSYAQQELARANTRLEEQANQAKEALQQVSKILESITDAFFALDPDWRFTYLNAEAERHLRRSRHDLLGKNIWEECAAGQFPVFFAQYHKAVAERVPVSFTDCYPPHNTWVEVHAYPSDNGLAVYFRDITAQKRADDALAESESKYRALAEAAEDYIFVLDRDGCVLYVNNYGARQLGLRPADAVGKRLFDQLFPPEIVDRQMQCVRKVFESGEPCNSVEKALISAREVWLDSRLVPIRSGGGDMTAVLGISRDITDHRRTADALHESEERYRHMVETANEGIWLVDEENRTTFVNEKVAEMLGYSVDEMVGRPLPDLLDHDAKAVTQHLELRRRGAREVYDFKFRHKTGSDVWAMISATPFLDRKGRYAGGLAMITDITERKCAEEDLRQSYDRLRRTLKGTIDAIAMTVEMRDPYTAGHQRRVARLACAIAQEMGMQEEAVEVIRLAASIHDIGKISVPSDILTKPGRLSSAEFGLIAAHPTSGHDILKTIEFPWPIAQIVLQHHERMDGSGYPSHLVGEETLQAARILAVADVVEAMSSHRPYRPALGIAKALDEIAQRRGLLYDPGVADACLRLFAVRGFAWE